MYREREHIIRRRHSRRKNGEGINGTAQALVTQISVRILLIINIKMLTVA